MVMAFTDAVINQPASFRNYQTSSTRSTATRCAWGSSSTSCSRPSLHGLQRGLRLRPQRLHLRRALRRALRWRQELALSQRCSTTSWAPTTTPSRVQYLALEIFAYATNSNLIYNPELKERIAIRRYTTPTTWPSSSADGDCRGHGTTNPAQVFVHNGEQYVYTYLKDRGWHLVANASRSPVSFQYMKDYNESLNASASATSTTSGSRCSCLLRVLQQLLGVLSHDLAVSGRRRKPLGLAPDAAPDSAPESPSAAADSATAATPRPRSPRRRLGGHDVRGDSREPATTPAPVGVTGEGRRACLPARATTLARARVSPTGRDRRGSRNDQVAIYRVRRRPEARVALRAFVATGMTQRFVASPANPGFGCKTPRSVSSTPRGRPRRPAAGLLRGSQARNFRARAHLPAELEGEPRTDPLRRPELMGSARFTPLPGLTVAANLMLQYRFLHYAERDSRDGA